MSDLEEKLKELKKSNRSLSDAIKGKSVDLSHLLDESKKPEKAKEKKCVISPRPSEINYNEGSPIKMRRLDTSISPTKSILKNSGKSFYNEIKSPSTEMSINFSSTSSTFASPITENKSNSPLLMKTPPKKKSDNFEYSDSTDEEVDYLCGIFDEPKPSKRESISPKKSSLSPILSIPKKQKYSFSESDSDDSDSEINIDKIRERVQRRRKEKKEMEESKKRRKITNKDNEENEETEAGKTKRKPKMEMFETVIFDINYQSNAPIATRMITTSKDIEEEFNNMFKNESFCNFSGIAKNEFSDESNNDDAPLGLGESDSNVVDSTIKFRNLGTDDDIIKNSPIKLNSDSSSINSEDINRYINTTLDDDSDDD